MADIANAAERWGVETSYVDALGERRTPDPGALHQIVRALATNAAAETPLRTSVVRRGRSPQSSVRPTSLQDIHWQLIGQAGLMAAGTSNDGTVSLPDLTIGSYRFVVEECSSGRSQPHLLLVCPDRAYQPDIFRDSRRLWLVAVQLYGVRSHRNWGIGDFTDLSALLAVAARAGAAGIALNPLHALAVGRPEHASPYSPSSRLFLNSLYIDVETVPGFPGTKVLGLADEITRLRTSHMVDYPGIAAAKTKALRASFAAFCAGAGKAHRNDFDAFKQERGEHLTRFAAFTTLQNRFHSAWWDWPAEWQKPTTSLINELYRTAAEEMDFHAFVQWQADRQLRACRDEARQLGLPVGLYLDVAVGVEADSADVWSEQQALVRGLSIGAPPDIWNPAGQNWGLASFHPGVLAASDFSLFRETLRSVMRYAGAVRLDHVLGLNRSFVIPQGWDPRRGTYVRFPLEAMLAVVAQESAAAKCLVIGEDLGTVPEGFRDILADWGVWSYRVMIFEREADGSFRQPAAYPCEAMVTFSTHDLATFAGWRTGLDLKVKRRLGLDPGEDDETRARARRALIVALSHGGDVGSDELSFSKVACFLARTPCRLLAVSIEDILGVADQTNVPGTVDEHPNWRRRLSVGVEDLATDERLRELAAMLESEGRGWAPGKRSV